MRKMRKLLTLITVFAIILSVTTISASASASSASTAQESDNTGTIVFATNSGAWYSTGSSGFIVNWNLAPIFAQLAMVYPNTSNFQIKGKLLDGSNFYVQCQNIIGSSGPYAANVGAGLEIIPA